MMATSHINKAFPIETWRYLLIIKATISVQPVLPLKLNTNPMPAPHKIPPKMQHING